MTLSLLLSWFKLLALNVTIWVMAAISMIPERTIPGGFDKPRTHKIDSLASPNGSTGSVIYAHRKEYVFGFDPQFYRHALGIGLTSDSFLYLRPGPRLEKKQTFWSRMFVNRRGYTSSPYIESSNACEILIGILKAGRIRTKPSTIRTLNM